MIRLRWISFSSWEVVDYLVKPFTFERFQRALDTFCRHREAVAGGEVTRARWTDSSPPPARWDRVSPKGLQEDTLERVRQCLRTAPPQGLPSEAVSRQTGLSVVTVRRYVNYLVERGEAASSVNYDTGGPPLPAVPFPDLKSQKRPPRGAVFFVFVQMVHQALAFLPKKQLQVVLHSTDAGDAEVLHQHLGHIGAQESGERGAPSGCSSLPGTAGPAAR